MMARILLFSIILLGTFSWAHYQSPGLKFLVHYDRGENWEQGIDYKMQKHVPEHVQFIKELYRHNQILLAGSGTPYEKQTVLFEDVSQAELRKKLLKDPAVKSKVLRFHIETFRMTMLKKVDHKHSSSSK